MISNKIKITFITLFSSITLYGGTDGTIRGQVTDVQGEPLIGAQVFIGELSIGSVADLNGNYLILNVPVGKYDVTVVIIGYQKQVMKDVTVLMDQTVWLNFKLPIETVEGEEVYVTAERPLVEKAVTSKKVTVSAEAISALPMRDLNELYSLQSGVVKVESRRQGIPDHEERGLEEIHVRGGRSGEIAYMIDGLYIRNPIYGGIGNGTRLNLFAVQEFDWQADGFNAEYGDAMSAVSNMHTKVGGENFEYHFKYETSLLGSELGSKYDALRGFNDLNFGFGGTFPFFKKLNYWFSGQFTNNDSYKIYEFDDIAYQLLPGQDDYFDFVFDENDPSYQTINNQNISNLVQPWDNVTGFRGFGLDNTQDVFGKLTYKHSSRLRFNVTYWDLKAHRKGFSPRYLYWDDGQNELFRDTKRLTFEMNHSISNKTFYTIRAAEFIQDQFQGVRWMDSDDDGYPNWFEWRFSAGEFRGQSNPYDADVIPYSMKGDTVEYTMKDGRSGWYYGATPGLYNWAIAEEFTDQNGNGIWDEGEPWEDSDGDGLWNKPELIEKLYHRDGSYWLTPEMYEAYWDNYDAMHLLQYYIQQPFIEAIISSGTFAEIQELFQSLEASAEGGDGVPYYYPNIFTGLNMWDERSAFGGHDKFYASSRAVTREFRFDLTSQVTHKLKLRSGIDFKSHRLNFYEVKYPWLGTGAFIQTFAEHWEDTGPDGLLPTDAGYEEADQGEGNGTWDPGEYYSDANENGKWDDFREPMELATYLQGTFEVPWMVINAGIRLDAVNYNTKVWADTAGNFSPGRPWYYSDINDNNEWDNGEEASDLAGLAHQKVFFSDSKWLYNLSPRLGVSHVITDKSTFTFNYGLYYQTPIYQNVFLNTNRLEDPEALFETDSDDEAGNLGNATMSAMRTQSYAFSFNVQVGTKWRYSVGAWIKDIDQWLAYKNQRSGVYKYKVFSNGDYGSVKGIDFTLELRTKKINSLLQYTYSVAKANSEHDWAQEDVGYVDAPSQEYRMPYDRPHDLTFSLYSFIPFGISAGITAFYQSGYPYTPYYIEEGQVDPQEDVKNKFSKRAPSYRNVNLSLSKSVSYGKQKISLGVNVYNVFDIRSALDIYYLTGKPDDPGTHYTDQVGLPDSQHIYSGSFFDQPWKFDAPREIDFFIKVDFE